jgi:hypothetical protein
MDGMMVLLIVFTISSDLKGICVTLPNGKILISTALLLPSMVDGRRTFEH